MKLPRFTLRDLFWLVLVAAMGCAWMSERTNQTRQIQKLERSSRDWEERANGVAASFCELEKGQWIEWNDDFTKGPRIQAKGPGSESRIAGWRPPNPWSIRTKNLIRAIEEEGYQLTWTPAGEVFIERERQP